MALAVCLGTIHNPLSKSSNPAPVTRWIQWLPFSHGMKRRIDTIAAGTMLGLQSLHGLLVQPMYSIKSPDLVLGNEWPRLLYRG